ncbi:hypothetical protein ACSS6W_009474 [Trichoderma asperelloides]
MNHPPGHHELRLGSHPLDNLPAMGCWWSSPSHSLAVDGFVLRPSAWPFAATASELRSPPPLPA